MDVQSNFSNPIIENLCKRYASARVVKTRAEIVAEERANALEKATHKETECVEIDDEVITAYKNGNKYMSSDAYAEMFRARRAASYSRSEKQVDTEETVVRREQSAIRESVADDETVDNRYVPASDNNPRYTEDEYEEYVRPAVKERCRAVQGKSLFARLISYIPVLIEVLKDWIECDPKILRVKRQRRAFPIIAFASVIVIAISLFLIVSSSVKLMEADSEISELKSQISEIQSEESLLTSKLEEKVSLPEVERIARDELGMIRREYISVKFLNDGEFPKNGTVEIYNRDSEDTNVAVIGTLLSALGIGK